MSEATARRTMEHDAIVAWAREAVRAADPAALADGFVASLGSRRLDRRSALGSYAAIRHLPAHGFTPSRRFHPSACAVCGVKAREEVDVAGLGSLRAKQDRLIRFTDVVYAAFDVATAGELPAAPPASADDRARLDALIAAIAALPPTATLAALQPAIAKTFASNKRERQYVLEALGVLGVLCPPAIPSFFDAWVERDDFEHNQAAHHHARDTAYPLQHWTGAAGVDRARLRAWFGGDPAPRPRARRR